LSRRKIKWREGDDEYIVVPIERWSWNFTYGLDAVRNYEPGTKQEYRHLQVFGRFQRPQRLAGPRVELGFVPSDRRSREGESPPPILPDSIGDIWRDTRRDYLRGVLGMPLDVLPGLLAVLATERLRYVVMVGAQKEPRKIAVREYSFVMDEEALPDDMTPDEDMQELRDLERRKMKGRT
jgi:hypothetical protein